MGTEILEHAYELALILGAMAVTAGIGFLALELVLQGIGHKLRPRQ